MDDDVAVVLHDPLGGFVAFDTEPGFPFRCHARIDFFREGVHLPPAGAGGQDKEVKERGDAAHVQDNHVASFVVGGHPGAEESVLNGDLRTRGLDTTQGCNLQRTSLADAISARKSAHAGGGVQTVGRLYRRSPPGWIKTSESEHLQELNRQSTTSRAPRSKSAI